MKAIKLAMILATAIPGSSYADKGDEYASIERTNQLLGENTQRLEDVFGVNLEAIRSTTRVKAVLVGGMDDPGNERYMIFPLQGKPIDIDREAARSFFTESKISLETTGCGKPEFASIFQGDRAEKKVVILVSPSASDNDKIWTFVESSTQKAPFSCLH